MSRRTNWIFLAALAGLFLPMGVDVVRADAPPTDTAPSQTGSGQPSAVRRGPGPGGPGGPGFRSMDNRPGSPEQGQTEEQLDDIISVLKDADPDFSSKVERARKESPRAVRDLLSTQGPRLFAMAQLKKNDPELYALRIDDFKLNRKIDSLSHDYARSVKDGKPDEQKLTEMKDLLQKQFDLRQKTREKELERMEKKVSDLREQIQRRKSNKDQMLADRLKELMDRSTDKDW